MTFSHSGIRLSIRLLRLHPRGCRELRPEASIDDGSCRFVEGWQISASTPLHWKLVDTADLLPRRSCQRHSDVHLEWRLENLADYLYVYDGADTTATLLGEPLTDQLNDNLFQATNGLDADHPRCDRRVLSCETASSTPSSTFVLRLRGVHGCMDVEACNYNPEAIIDDGSCAELDCLGVCGGSAVLDEVWILVLI